MNKLFDTTPMAYVGADNKYYTDLTKTELEEMKKNRVTAEPLPESNEVEESSASVIGPMLPQVGLTGETVVPEEEEVKGADDISTEDMLVDAQDDVMDMLESALNNEVCGADIYLESTGLFDKLKEKFKKDTDKAEDVDTVLVMKVAKAYTNMRLSNARIQLALTKDKTFKGTEEYRTLQKKAVAAEKELRQLKKDLNDEEEKIFNDYIKDFDSSFHENFEKHMQDIDEVKKASETVKTESTESKDDVGIDKVTDVLNAYTHAMDLEASLKDDKKDDDKSDEEIQKQQAKVDEAYDEFKRLENDLTSNEKNLLNILKKQREILSSTDVAALIKKGMFNIKESSSENEEEHDAEALTKAKQAYKKMKALEYTVNCYKHKHEAYEEKLKKFADEIDDAEDKLKDQSDIFKKFNNRLSISDRYLMRMYSMDCDDTFDQKLKDYKDMIEKSVVEHLSTESVEYINEMYESMITEADIDDDMKPIIKALNRKGYKTLASSSGHPDLIAKDDEDKDGVRDGRYYSDARLAFDGKYNFGKAPKYWYWKKLKTNASDVDYLDLEQMDSDNAKDRAEWKKNYMASLKEWVDELPAIEVHDEDDDITTEAVDPFLTIAAINMSLIALAVTGITTYATVSAVKSIVGRINLKKCAKILKEENADFINPKDMKIERYPIKKILSKIEKSEDKEAGNIRKVLLKIGGNYLDIYTYRNKPIFSSIRTTDMLNSDTIEKKIYFNMIDESLAKFKEFYLAYVAKKQGVRVKEAYNWASDFLKSHKEAEEDNDSVEEEKKEEVKKEYTYEEILHDIDVMLESTMEELLLDVEFDS